MTTQSTSKNKHRCRARAATATPATATLAAATPAAAAAADAAAAAQPSRHGIEMSLLVCLCVLLSWRAQADAFRIAHFVFIQSADAGHYTLNARIPADIVGLRNIGWPIGCRQIEETRQIAGHELLVSFDIACAQAPSSTDSILVPWPLDGATFDRSAAGVPPLQVTVAGTQEGIRLPFARQDPAAPPSIAVAGKYVMLGIAHILTGWDHLAFILCLCLLIRGRAMILLITAFTVGHSVSLALAFLGIVHVPRPPVEALIALSIAVLAREAFLARERRNEKTLWLRYILLVVGFGLVHGLGFASALRELGVSPSIRALGLVGFNIGVEIGQLLFVGMVTTLMVLAERLGIARPIRLAAVAGAGTLGGFWMVERLASFLVAV
jgi:hypothetical protein